MQGKIKAIIALGVLVFVVPFFGIPFSAKQWTIALLGLIIVFVAARLRAEVPRKIVEKETPIFVENGHKDEESQDDE